MNTHPLPADWTTSAPNSVGVSRNTREGAYFAVLLLNGRQVTFGPFRASRLEAEEAHDRLLHYFLPFAKACPVPNCLADYFSEFDDAETEVMYGAVRLPLLRARLRAEMASHPVPELERAESALAFIAGNYSAGQSTPRRCRATSIKALEALKLQLIRDVRCRQTLQDRLSVVLSDAASRAHRSDLLKKVFYHQSEYTAALSELVNGLRE